MIRILRPNSEDEQNVLIGMIVSDRYLAEVKTMLRPAMFNTPFGKTVSSWCFDYYRQYEKAPKETIQDLYQSYTRTVEEDDPNIKLIGQFLDTLSKKHSNEKSFNVEYHLDTAQRFAKRRSLEMLKEDITLALSSDSLEEAEDKILRYNRVELVKTAGLSLLYDEDKVKEIYFREHEGQDLLEIHGDLGEVLRSCFCRSDLISFAGPGKRGKTWWLLYMAALGIKSKLKVLYASLEMSERQTLMRILQNLTGEPKTERELDIPFFDDNSFVRQHRHTKAGLSFPAVKKRIDKIKTQSLNADLRIICYPPETATASDLQNYIDRAVIDYDFLPDILVVDYADNMAPEIGGDHRNMIDNRWKGLKKLAMQNNILVVTATHTAKQTFTKDIKQSDMSEDIRKLNHVSCMVALNQTEREMNRGIMRVSVIAHRHEEYSVGKSVCVLCNFKTGQPHIDSRFASKVGNLEE